MEFRGGWRRFWAFIEEDRYDERNILISLVAMLSWEDMKSLVDADERCKERIVAMIQTYKRQSMRLALGTWIQRRIQVEVQAKYQEHSNVQVSRSRTNDPRVPGRTVSVWTEAGNVPNGFTSLRLSSCIPQVTPNGVLIQFDASNVDDKPMLMNVIQRGRKVYSVLSITMEDDNSTDRRVLRQFTYGRDTNELERVLIPRKRLLDAYGALLRYDLISKDGSVAIQLQVPRGANADVDYYIISKLILTIHLGELYQPIMQTSRSIAPLPLQGSTTDCIIKLDFTTLAGKPFSSFQVDGRLHTEPNTSSSQSHQNSRTEALDIIACSAIISEDAANSTTTLSPPEEAGYVFVCIHTTHSQRRYFYFSALHDGKIVDSASGVAHMKVNWLPGVLQLRPTPASKRRKSLTGTMRISYRESSGQLLALNIVGQWMHRHRLEGYAAQLLSYTRHETSRR